MARQQDHFQRMHSKIGDVGRNKKRRGEPMGFIPIGSVTRKREGGERFAAASILARMFY